MTVRSRPPSLLIALLLGALALVTTVGATAAPASASAGPSATASATQDLDPDGQRVTVSGSGFDPTKGVYVALCVDRGAGALATPCIGGIDTSGSASSSAWVSSNPPAYGEGLATPYGPGGTFDVTIQVSAADQFADCLDPASAPSGCALFVRADHTRAGDRSQDVRIPVTWASGATTEDGSGDDSGGAAAGEQDQAGAGSAASGGQAGDEPVAGSGAPGALARTGASVAAVGGAAAVLLALGTTVLLVTRRRRDEPAQALR
ncbi:hypothetical protein [Aquipuribacter sp. MA13-6]|uniref:hypothetical protein n=1 Tax=unclassified Aquipuribacter TaxID=2635084 RepID=UPI003EEB4037